MDSHTSSGERRTERYIHVTVEKNSKGYNKTSSYSIRTDDPDLDIGTELAKLDMIAAHQESDAVALRVSLESE